MLSNSATATDPARKSESRAVDEARISADLQIALGRVVRRLRQVHVPGDLTLSETSVLARLERGGPASPSELAIDEHVRPQAMCTTLGTLERQALVTRAADPADGRRAVMSVTEAGRQLLMDRRGIKAERMARALSAGFSIEEQRQLADATMLLDRLADLL
jgi:DNA-binding MarR family transcriptional regulator